MHMHTCTTLSLALQVWDIRSREPLATYKGHAGAVLKAKFSPDGKLIASGDELGVLRVRLREKKKKKNKKRERDIERERESESV